MPEVMEKTQEQVQTQNKNTWEEKFFNEPLVKPAINISENENSYSLTAEMPGLNKDNLKIRVEDNSLLIMGSMDVEEKSGQNFILKESCTGNYFREIRISDDIDREKISANYENGVLSVELPKNESAKPRQIEIK